MLAREREEPLHEACRTLGGLTGGVQGAFLPIVTVAGSPKRKIDIAKDGGEQAVEVMRDAAREAADRSSSALVEAPVRFARARTTSWRSLGIGEGLTAFLPQRHDAKPDHRNRRRQTEDQMAESCSSASRE